MSYSELSHSKRVSNFWIADVKELLNRWREENGRNSLKIRDVYAHFNLDHELGDESMFLFIVSILI